MRNNGTKILVLPGESLKSQKTDTSDNRGQKYLRLCKFKQNLTICTGGEMLEFTQESRTQKKFEFVQISWELAC